MLFEDADFTFVVDGVEYKCCRLQALMFSRKLRKRAQSDRTLREFCLQIDDERGEFNDIIRLMNGNTIKITNANAIFLEQCARELGNDELMLALLELKAKTESLSMSNAGDRIRLKQEFSLDCEEEIAFIASHFYEADIQLLSGLGIDVLEAVLQSRSLKLMSEDLLFRVLVELIDSHDAKYASLLRYVQFMFLDTENMNAFFDRVFPDLLDISIWNSIRKCLGVFRMCRDKDSLACEARYQHGLIGTKKIETCDAGKGDFVGIMSHLRDICGGNPHENGIMDITASSSNRKTCRRLVDYGWNDWWGSNDRKDSYVQFDFKAIKVCVSDYAIQSDGDSGHHLRSWVLEASNGGERWDELDNRYTSELDGKYIVKNYNCKLNRSTFYRLIRLRQTGKNTSDSNYLKLSQIEFFGKVAMS